MWSWAPLEVAAGCPGRAAGHPAVRGHWNAMLFPLVNTTAAGGLVWEGELAVQRGENETEWGCVVGGMAESWLRDQHNMYRYLI